MQERKQARERYNRLTEKDRQTLVNNICEELWFADAGLQARILRLFGQVEPELEKKLRERLQF